MYLDTLEVILPPHSIHHSPSSLVFRVVLEREREAKIATIPCRVYGRQIQARFLLSFLSLLFFFLTLVLCFVIFNLNIEV